jgi:DNA-binding response OmpR family regulator
MYSQLKELKVLLVEDEKKLAYLLKKAIGDNFSSFYVENNGKDGLERFIKLSPDLVITDIMMPDLTGIEMAIELKKINPDIKIIILSAFSDKEKLLSAIDIGIVKYFIKPFDPEELLDYIVSISAQLKNDITILNNDFSFNNLTNSLYKNDKYISLTKRENIFIQLLIQNQNNMINNDVINQKLWNDTILNEERLRTFIRRFRLKTSKELITNIKALGYQLTLS